VVWLSIADNLITEMKNNLLRLAALLIVSLVYNPLSAQWKMWGSFNSPFPDNALITHVRSDMSTGNVYALAFDTSSHFYKYAPATGWTAHHEFNQTFKAAGGMYEMKARNGKVWCFTANGLLKYENGSWTMIPFPAGYSRGTSGFYVDADDRAWFSGGPQSGVTCYNGTTWKNYNKIDYPSFEQDYFIMDIQMDEPNNTIWMAMNCHLAGGIYALDLDEDKITRIHPGEAKYNCAHSVVAGKNNIFVGTCNFSSVRIMDKAGNYTQSLDAPKVGCVNRMVIDPVDSSRVWVVTDRTLIYFGDTVNYLTFDKDNAGFSGFGSDVTHEKLSGDSMRVWFGTSRGLYSYDYKAGDIRVGLAEKTALHELVSVYPNPSAGMFRVTMPGNEKDNAGVEVLDVNGRKVACTIQSVDGGFSIDLSEAPRGIYFLSVSKDGARAVKKLVLTR
jgi:hypothetical protein